MTISATEPRSALARWLRTILIIGGAIAVYAAVALLVGMLTGDAIAGSAAANIAAFLLAIGYRWISTGSVKPAAEKAVARTLDFWVYAVAALILFWVAGQALASWVYQSWGSGGYDSLTTAKMHTSIWLLLLASLILAPIGEESLIRGIAYPALRRHWPPFASALVTAAVFAVLHGNLVQIVLTIPLGVLLALVYETCQRLWPIIAMHVLFNLGATLVPRGLIESVAHPLFAFPVAVLGIAVVYFGMGQRRLRSAGR